MIGYLRHERDDEIQALRRLVEQLSLRLERQKALSERGGQDVGLLVMNLM